MQQVVSLCSAFLSTKIKIIQRVLVTEQTRNPIQTKEGEITPKVRKPVVILVRNMPSCPVLHFYQVLSKYSERYSCYRADMKSNSNTIRGDNTKSKKAKVVILVRVRLSRTVLHFHQVSQKYSKGIQLTVRTRNQCIQSDVTKGDYAKGHKGKKARVVILVCYTWSSPDLQFYQVS